MSRLWVEGRCMAVCMATAVGGHMQPVTALLSQCHLNHLLTALPALLTPAEDATQVFDQSHTEQVSDICSCPPARVSVDLHSSSCPSAPAPAMGLPCPIAAGIAHCSTSAVSLTTAAVMLIVLFVRHSYSRSSHHCATCTSTR